MREAGLTLVPGRKGVGKSHDTIAMMNEYVKDRPGVPGRRVLVLDVNDEFQQYTPLDVRQVKDWCLTGPIEIRRIRIWNTYGKNKDRQMTLDEISETLSVILRAFFRGLLLIEDLNNFVQDTIPGDLFGRICTQRHVAVDVIIHFQTVKRIGHPKLWPNCNYVRMHRCDDSIKNYPGRYVGFERPLRIMEELIKIRNEQDGNDHFNCWLNKDKRKISGNFTNAELMRAIEEYMSEDYSQVVAPFMNKVDLNNGQKRVKNPAEAAEIIKNDIYNTWNGNIVRA